jgi:hypothetical protein
MEGKNFESSQEYRDELAKSIKKIEDHDERRDALEREKEENSAMYDVAKLDRGVKNSQERELLAEKQIKERLEATLRPKPVLSKEDLVYLYESKDSRMAELRTLRNPKEDAPVVLGCKPNQVAWGRNELTENTKAYIGPLFPGVFELKKLEHLYTSFPGKKIELRSYDVGGKSLEFYIREANAEGCRITGEAIDWMIEYHVNLFHMSEDKARERAIAYIKGAEKPVIELARTTKTVRLSIADLNVGKDHRGLYDYKQIMSRAFDLGLDMAPAELGPVLLHEMKESPVDETVTIMTTPQLVGRESSLLMVSIQRREDEGNYLTVKDADRLWETDSMVFAFHKP